MDKTDLLRALNHSHPNVVERLILSWGKADFNNHLDGLINAPANGSNEKLVESQITLLSKLRALHDREYPLYASKPAGISEKLAQNEDFKIVNQRFPHIGKRLAALWGKDSLGVYIDSMMNDTRGGSRQGFPPEIAFSLFHLAQTHSNEFPQFTAKSSDTWELS